MVFISVLDKLWRLPRKIQQIIYIHFYRIWFSVHSVHYGKNMRIFNKIFFHVANSKGVYIGDNFVMSSGGSFNPLSRNAKASVYVRNGGYLKIGNNVGMSSPVLWVENSIIIGNNCTVGANCIIIDSDAHPIDYLSRRNNGGCNVKSKPIVIGDDAWIGTNVIILKGVHIGKRSIIGAGSVVTKDVPENAVAAGNPCKVLRYV